MISVAHLTTLPLRHHGDCSLLGVTPDGTIYAEEVYDDDGWVAQHELRPDGSFVRSVDEDHGTAQDIRPLDLPDDAIPSKTCWRTMPLNFAGPRHRGLREPERVLDLVRSLSIDEKLALISKSRLNLPPPMLLGMAESYVLAETEIVRPNLYFVCRRIRLAYALPQLVPDADGQPYDYDTQVMYLAHFHEFGDDLRLLDLLADLTDVPLHRPMDCLRIGDRLYIADGGADDRLSAIHVWKLDLPEEPTEEEKLLKKLYG